MSLHINRTKYANMYGPTVGDKVRLGDTELIIEVEKDHTIYGEENKFGGGKTIRDGMSQSSTKKRDEEIGRSVRAKCGVQLRRDKKRHSRNCCSVKAVNETAIL